MDKQHLAACHCKTSHPELFLYMSNGTKLSFRSDELQDKIEYVEDECEDALRWKDIKPNSKDYIWPIYCPIYGTIKRLSPKQLKKDDALQNLLEDGWNILKPGGKIVVLKGNDDSAETFAAKLAEWSTHNGNHPWKIEIVESSSLDYIVHDSRKPKSNYIILTKPSTGGKRTKTLRNKRIRNVTKYRRIR